MNRVTTNRETCHLKSDKAVVPQVAHYCYLGHSPRSSQTSYFVAAVQLRFDADGLGPVCLGFHRPVPGLGSTCLPDVPIKESGETLTIARTVPRG
jgi:hypothetical protein